MQVTQTSAKHPDISHRDLYLFQPLSCSLTTNAPWPAARVGCVVRMLSQRVVSCHRRIPRRHGACRYPRSQSWKPSVADALRW